MATTPEQSPPRRPAARRLRARRATGVVVLGLAVALLIAFFVSPFASSQPDGLERVAIDKGFEDTAKDHALGDGPLADYAVSGVKDERLSTGVAGVIGVGLCFVIGTGVFLAVRKLRPHDAPTHAPPTQAPAAG